MNILKRHLTVANVLSCMALFVALSGVAYAATLGKNQVKAKNIAKEAVTSPKLKRGAVTSAKLAGAAVINGKIANGAVTGSKLANETVGSGKLAKNAVTASKLGTEAVTTGKLGNEAVTTGKLGNESVGGAKLSASLLGQLVKNVTYVTETTTPSATDFKSIDAPCPAGKEVLGGGVRINNDTEAVVVPTDSAPLLSGSAHVGWSAAAREEAATAVSWSVTAFAICAEL